MPEPTLYRRVLGDRFAELHPPLQAFHACQPRSIASGPMAVEHGSGWAARWIAWLLGVPPEAADGTVVLEVSCADGVETWQRTFGRGQLPGKRLTTWQWQRGPLLVEASRLVAVGFDLQVREGGLLFVTRRVWWCGVPVPRWFGPLIAASAVPAGEGWIVDIRIAGPLVGTILRYSGKVSPQ
jgi:hypothetical protein